MISNKGSFNIQCDREFIIAYSKLVFSGGEVQVMLDSPYSLGATSLTIEAHLTNSDKVMELVLLTDALRRLYGEIPISLICPYVPYARQDRVMNPGEALAVKVMCDLINNLKFSSVEVWDVHSDVTLALLERVKNYRPETFVQRIPVCRANTVLVAPDAGSLKKVAAVAKSLNFKSMVRADKIRSTKDGSITGTVVYSEHIGADDFLIVDDLCDGGRTFTELATELKKLTNGRVLLYVTHGIFSRSLSVFTGLIDHVFTAMPFPGVLATAEPKYTHLKFERP